MKKIILLLTILLVGCTPKQKEREDNGFVVKETTLSQIEHVFNDLEDDLALSFEVDYKNYDVKKSYVTFYQDGKAKNILIIDDSSQQDKFTDKEVFVAEQYLYYGFKRIDNQTITATDRSYGNDGLSSSLRKVTGATTSPKEIGYDLSQASVYMNGNIDSLNEHEIMIAAISFPSQDDSQKTNMNEKEIKQMIQEGHTVITITVTIDPILESVKSKRECL